MFNPIITWDTAHYFSFIEIFEGAAPFSSWDIVRGPVFPLIIHISNILFGKTVQGLLILTFLFYIIMIWGCNKTLKVILTNEKNEKLKKTIYIVTMSLIIFNPIIFGYYHSILTEFVAMTLSVVMCYFSYRWLEYDFFKTRKKYLLSTIIFAILTVFAWYLKQPYVSTVLFPLMAAILVSIINKRTLKNFIQRIALLIICLLTLFLASISWNNFLEEKGVDTNGARSSGNILGNQLVKALNNFEIIDTEEIYTEEYIESNPNLSNKQKELLLSMIRSGKENYLLTTFVKNNKTEYYTIIYTENGNISSSNAIKFVLTSFAKHPVSVINSYISNYFGAINVFPTYTEDGVTYHLIKRFDLRYTNENSSISYRIYQNKNNIFYMTDEMYSRVLVYEQKNNSPIYINKVVNNTELLFGIGFKLLFLTLPFALIGNIILKIKTKNIQIKGFLNLSFILLFYSFFHVLLHAVTGAIIDRYVSPAIITSILGIILFIYLLFKQYKIRKN